MKKKFLVLILLFSAAVTANAQLNVKKEAVKIWFFKPGIALQLPMGSMKERFYPNTAISFGLSHKTKSNWLIEADWRYIFAEKVRNEDEILKNITTSEGFVIDQTGVFANIYFRERGFNAAVGGGKLWNLGFGNPNSGLAVIGALGVLQHKILIENYENTAPQLRDDYIKGYDKLTFGPFISLYVGYIHFSNLKLANFSVGVEYLYAPTKSMRNYDFVLMKRDDRIRNDQLLSLKFVWSVPVYKRAPKEFYYN